MSKLPEERSEIRTSNDPKNFHRTVIHHILGLDIAGLNQGDVAKKMGMTQPWVSRIQNSPTYVRMKEDQLRTLHEKVTDKVSTNIADAESQLKEAKAEAATTLIDLMRNARTESVRASVAEKIVDRGRETKGGVNVVVQINERLAERFDKVLKYEEGSSTR